MISEDSLREICEGRIADESKPYVLQAFSVKLHPETNAKVFKLYDKVSSVIAGTKSQNTLKDYDLILLKDRLVTKLKGELFIYVKEFEIVQSGLSSLAGNPVEMTNNVVQVPKSIPHPLEAPPIIKDGNEEDLMSRRIKRISELDMKDTHWTIKVQLINKGEVISFTRKKDGKEGKLLPIELMDSQGTRITAKLFDEDIEKFGKDLQLGNCYLILNGTIKPADPRRTNTAQIISLNKGSMICPTADDLEVLLLDSPPFTKILDILQIPPGKVVNVIGAVVSLGNVTDITLHSGETVKTRTIQLADESGSISVTLWRDFSEAFIKENEIIALQSVRVKNYKGKQLNTMKETALLRHISHSRSSLIQRS